MRDQRAEGGDRNGQMREGKGSGGGQSAGGGAAREGGSEGQPKDGPFLLEAEQQQQLDPVEADNSYNGRRKRKRRRRREVGNLK